MGTEDNTRFFLISICTDTDIPHSPRPRIHFLTDLCVLWFPGVTKGGAVILQTSMNAVTPAPALMGDASIPPAPTLVWPARRATGARAGAV